MKKLPLWAPSADKKARIPAANIAIIAVCGALLYVSQVAFSFLPNIELVSPLIILYTRHLKRLTLPAIYVFAMIEGLTYGFGLWWVAYLYVWTVLYGVAALVERYSGGSSNPFLWAVIAALFGLFFGLLCSVPYFFTLGFGGGVSYFLSGIPFDFLHCGGNFITTLVLFLPLDKLFGKIRSYAQKE